MSLIDVDPKTLSLLLIVVNILIGIIGYFIKDKVSGIQASMKELSGSVHSIALKIPVIDTRLDRMEDRIEVLSPRTHALVQDVAVIKHKLGIGND